VSRLDRDKVLPLVPVLSRVEQQLGDWERVKSLLEDIIALLGEYDKAPYNSPYREARLRQRIKEKLVNLGAEGP